jgi:predicted aspartyl protease
LQLRARIEDDGHAYVIGFLRPPNSNQYQYVRFLVDTGCSITTLLSDDAARLAINCRYLTQATFTVTTANGRVHPWCIVNPDFLLPVRYGLFHRKKTLARPPLRFICCMAPTGNPAIPYTRTNSALGMDVLNFFEKWQFKDDILIMKG